MLVFTRASPKRPHRGDRAIGPALRPLGPSRLSAAEARVARIVIRASDDLARGLDGVRADAVFGGERYDQVLGLLPWDGYVKALGEIEAELLAMVSRVGTSTYKEALPSFTKRVEEPDGGFVLAFDAQNARVLLWARTRIGRLITQITSRQLDMIRMLVTRTFTEEGFTPQRLRRALRNVVGLTDRQARSVATLARTLEAEGVAPERIERLLSRKRARLLRHRATTIARTELMTAANEGRLESWRQLGDDGLFSRTRAEKEWITGSKPCPICAPQDGVRVGLDGLFDTAAGFLDGPPAHPSCRCTTALVVE